MYALDTNHISALERRGPEIDRLLSRLFLVPALDIKVTVISCEEQIRGWTAAIAGAKISTAQVAMYNRLLEQLENYCNLSIIPFDDAAAVQFDRLRKLHRRISTPDLKIAAIALVQGATVLTKNERDFKVIEGLSVEDWTL